MFLDKKTMLEIWLNPGLNLTIFSMRNQAQKIICLTPIWGTCLFFSSEPPVSLTENHLSHENEDVIFIIFLCIKR